jgi:hypothetical protein
MRNGKGKGDKFLGKHWCGGVDRYSRILLRKAQTPKNTIEFYILNLFGKKYYKVSTFAL